MQDENLKHLFQRAKSVMLQSYSPYSKFKVGAALLCKDGKIFCGCNYESVAFGAGVCAERVALGAAITAGEHEFDTIVVCGTSKSPVMPCGVCRQALLEFGEIMVVCCNEDGSIIHKFKSSELLPSAFLNQI